MTVSRRSFLSAAAVTAAAAGPLAGQAAAGDNIAEAIVAAFQRVPGKHALKFWAPATADAPEWTAELNPDDALFCGSAFKVFVLTEYLRQIDGDAAALRKALAEPQVLAEDVWSPTSPVFNPPELSGKVTMRTVLEAMIAHSDNTATDMALRRTGVEQVRQFVASIGLKSVRIPTSTRRFCAYISGQPDWAKSTWPVVQRALTSEKNPYPFRPIINDQETMVGSPNDFVSFYARAIKGEFFTHPATLELFRAILSQSDAIARVIPLGVSAFMKGGSIEFANDHVIALAGAIWIPERWVTFAMLTNSHYADIESKFLEAALAIFGRLKNGLKA